MKNKSGITFNPITYYKNANRSDKATIWLFAIVILELALAHSPFLAARTLVDFFAPISSSIPAFRLAETEEARTYMTLTSLLSPLVTWLMYIAEWEGKSFGDLMPLPKPGEKHSARTIVSFVALLLFTGATSYFCFGIGVSALSNNSFLLHPFDPFKLWSGWAIYRLVPFCFCWALLLLVLKSLLVQFERNARS